MDQQHDYGAWFDAPVLRETIAQLPELPPVIRYYDDFDDTLRSIRNPSGSKRFDIHVDGRVAYMKFDHASEHYSALLKQVVIYLLGEDLAASTVLKYIHGARHLDSNDAIRLLEAGPTSISSFWTTLIARDLPHETYALAKSILKLLCKYQLRDWSESYRDVISALPLPFKDKYAVVRSGDAFLSANDEAAIVRFFDETAKQCATLSLAV
jgi:hypothetical protein